MTTIRIETQLLDGDVYGEYTHMFGTFIDENGDTVSSTKVFFNLEGLSETLTIVEDDVYKYSATLSINDLEKLLRMF